MPENLVSKVRNSLIIQRFSAVRSQTTNLCQPLAIEDFVAQPVQDVSPPKWHLAHTTWFFEVFLLVPYLEGYQLYNKDFPRLFNSYYVAAGDRWTRAERGQLTRPMVHEIMSYRSYVEKYVEEFLASQELNLNQKHIMEIGLQHEQQHQELLLYDIKFILGRNPLFPVYKEGDFILSDSNIKMDWLGIDEGVYEVGFEGSGFHFDNEDSRHKVYLHSFEIGSRLVNNEEYLEFMVSGGYGNHQYWLSEGWDWVCEHEVEAPMYWVKEEGKWCHYTLKGLSHLDPKEPVSHISFFEADAYARWKGCRLPTEFEWEVAARTFSHSVPEGANFVDSNNLQPFAGSDFDFYGNLWEWTSSSYLPYPYYKAPDGALGEYNGKFMINQKVLRGGSYATPKDHIRLTYRNFFHPHLQWHFNGIRLAQHV